MNRTISIASIIVLVALVATITGCSTPAESTEPAPETKPTCPDTLWYQAQLKAIDSDYDKRIENLKSQLKRNHIKVPEYRKTFYALKGDRARAKYNVLQKYNALRFIK